jgi:hypothetical protein
MQTQLFIFYIYKYGVVCCLYLSLLNQYNQFTGRMLINGKIEIRMLEIRDSDLKYLAWSRKSGTHVECMANVGGYVHYNSVELIM